MVNTVAQLLKIYHGANISFAYSKLNKFSKLKSTRYENFNFYLFFDAKC